MNITNIRSSLQKLLNRCRYFFQSGNGQQKMRMNRDEHKVDKGEGKGEEDMEMRGNNNLNRLNQQQKSYSPIHSQQLNPFSLNFIASKLPNQLARLLAKIVQHPKSQLSSESMYLPKMEPGSIPVYDTVKYNYYVTNKMWIQLLPMYIFFCSTEPLFTTFSAIAGYMVYFTFFWSKTKQTAIKIQLLPHRQEIKILLANIYGNMYTKTYKIQDFQMITLQGYDWIQKKLFNEYIVIKHKLTGQLILFDRLGIWHEQGINHELLN